MSDQRDNTERGHHNSANDALAKVWRVPTETIENGSSLGLIFATGMPDTAEVTSSSENFYPFTTTDSEVEPLGIVGTKMEIINFIKHSKNHGIKNEIKELPDIYMGLFHIITPTNPRHRLSEISVMGRILEDVADYVKFAEPEGLDLKEIVENGLMNNYRITNSTSSDFHHLSEDEKIFNIALEGMQNLLEIDLENTEKPEKIINRLRKLFTDEDSLEHIFCIKFHYLPDNDMIKVGTNQFLFKELLDPKNDYSRIFEE